MSLALYQVQVNAQEVVCILTRLRRAIGRQWIITAINQMQEMLEGSERDEAIISNMPPLSQATEQRLCLCFPDDARGLVRHLLLEECGNNLPGLEESHSETMDRFRFAVLKLSGGDLAGLERALLLARTDWRDLLMAAGFGEDAQAHTRWLPGNSDARAPGISPP